MALAKAFPETYQYELNEPTTVRTTFVTFTAIIYNFVGQTCMSMYKNRDSHPSKLNIFSRPQTSGFRYPRPASVPPSPALSRHSSPHHSEAEDDNDDECYDEDLEAEKDRVNIRQPYSVPFKNKSSLPVANGNSDGVAAEKN